MYRRNNLGGIFDSIGSAFSSVNWGSALNTLAQTAGSVYADIAKTQAAKAQAKVQAQQIAAQTAALQRAFQPQSAIPAVITGYGPGGQPIYTAQNAGSLNINSNTVLLASGGLLALLLIVIAARR